MQYEDGSISPVKAFFKNKWVRLILIIDALALIAVVIILIINATKTATINLNITPVDATISINGDTKYTNGSYSMNPGTYEVKISHDDLEPKTFTVELSPDYITTVTTFLSGTDNNFEFYELKDNYSSTQKLQEIASAGHNITTDQDTSAEQFIEEYTRILSISEKFPIKGYVQADPSTSSPTAGFAIRDGIGKAGCEKIACLLVNYYGTGYEEAVMAKIKEAGYNPADYQILYERYD